MVNKVLDAKAIEDYVVEVVFFNGEIRQYDVKPLFTVFPQFCILQKEKSLFERVQVEPGGYGISWNDELDLEAETLWEDGVLIERRKKPDLNHLLAYRLAFAREECGMTQKDLAEKTGIHQAEISKLERGIGNPSLLTLQRIAEGLDLELQIDFLAKNSGH